MFNFRHRDQLVPSTISAIAIVILAATLAYMLLVPPPSAAGIARGRTRSKQQLENEIDKAKAQSAAAEVAAGNRLWTGNADTVMAQLLAQLTTRADRYRLKMSAFRPQRPVALGSLTELPSTVQITGPYNTVVAFLNSLDAPDTRIALRSAQISAADGATSATTATLALSIYFVDTTSALKAILETGGSRG